MVGPCNIGPWVAVSVIGHRWVWWHRLHKNLRGAGKPGGLTCGQGKVQILTCLIVYDRCLKLIQNGWRCSDRPKTLIDKIDHVIVALLILLWDCRRDEWWHGGRWHRRRRHRYHRGRPDIFHFFRISFRLLFEVLLQLFIFLPDRLHYVSNQSLLIILTLNLTFIKSDYDPLYPRLDRLRTPLDGEFFSFHLVLVLLLID